MPDALDLKHGLKPSDGLWPGCNGHKWGHDACPGLDKIGLKVEDEPTTGDTIHLKLRHQPIFRT